ncbi:MAG: hypothetical protein LBG63_00275 [Candidatus Methanoplasma sp.]|nr:hypothetical protein [Candidatus Methanoplasma sp.]
MFDLKCISKGNIILFAVCIAFVAAVMVGIIYSNWAPLFYLVLILCLILFLQNIYNCLEDWLEKYLPLNPKLPTPPNGKDNIEVICTKYLCGNGPIYIDLNGEKIGKVYRGRSTSALFPEGLNQISAYRNKDMKVLEEMIVQNGGSLMIWSDNAIPPTFHATFLSNDEKFDEESQIQSYKKTRKTIIGLTYSSMPLGIAGIVMMFFILWSMGYL